MDNFIKVMKMKGLGEAHVLLTWLWFLNNIFAGIQATMHDMACKCGNMPSGKFSSQLNKLVRLGIVEKIPIGKNHYQFRIVHKVESQHEVEHDIQVENDLSQAEKPNIDVGIFSENAGNPVEPPTPSNTAETPQNKAQNASNPFAKWLDPNYKPAKKTPIDVRIATPPPPPKIADILQENQKQTNYQLTIDQLFLNLNNQIDQIEQIDDSNFNSIEQVDEPSRNSANVPQAASNAPPPKPIPKPADKPAIKTAIKPATPPQIGDILAATENLKQPPNVPQAESSSRPRFAKNLPPKRGSIFAKVRQIAPAEKQTYLAFMCEEIIADKPEKRDAVWKAVYTASKGKNPGAYLNWILEHGNDGIGKNEINEYRKKAKMRFHASKQ
jgi:hypothetical protein